MSNNTTKEISEPMLEPIIGGVVDHVKAFKTLKSCDYDRWVSIEMKRPQSHELLIKSVNLISAYLQK